MKKISLLIMDLDNTVYDWYAAFVPAFYAMIEKASEIIGCDKNELLEQIKSVHISRKDVEHPFSLIETPIVREFSSKIGEDQAFLVLDPAFYAFNKTRKMNLHLFKGVQETFLELQKQQVKIVAFTESRYFSTVGRIERLNISNYFSGIYCRDKNESSRPFPYKIKKIGDFSDKIIVLPADALKPNPNVLRRIISDFECLLEETAYIGDSISKDIAMAKEVGCYSIWAKYGTFTDPEMYEKLIKISHWSEEDIKREKQYTAMSKYVIPDLICNLSMSEILDSVSGIR